MVLDVPMHEVALVDAYVLRPPALNPGVVDQGLPVARVGGPGGLRDPRGRDQGCRTRASSSVQTSSSVFLELELQPG